MIFLTNSLKYGFVKNLFQIGLDSIVGRISFNNSDILTSIHGSQTIEQVWNCSHREIESFNKNSKVTYLKASRDGWHRPYCIESLRCVSKTDKSLIINQFVEVAKSIELNREKIENFINYLKSLNIDELCLEYMLSGDKFGFIDWDTKQDKKVINSLFPYSNVKEDFVL